MPRATTSVVFALLLVSLPALADNPPPAAQAHKDIRILFTVADRHYEAVGFLKKGEAVVDGYEMLARTAGENGGAIKGEDEAFLRKHLGELPEFLQSYALTTSQRRPGRLRDVSCFGWIGGRWYQFWNWLGDTFYDGCLVVRRLP